MTNDAKGTLCSIFANIRSDIFKCLDKIQNYSVNIFRDSVNISKCKRLKHITVMCSYCLEYIIIFSNFLIYVLQ